MNSRERARKFRKIMNIIFDDEDEDDLVELLDSHAEEQRQECADKVHDCLQNYGIRQDAIYDASEACLNAVEKSDDK